MRKTHTPEEQKNYAVNCAKVYNWLVEYQNNNPWFVFCTSSKKLPSDELKNFLFSGIGNGKIFVWCLFKAYPYNGLAVLFDLDENFAKIKRVSFRVEWSTNKKDSSGGKKTNKAYAKLAKSLGLAALGKQQETKKILSIDNPDSHSDDKIREALCNWIGSKKSIFENSSIMPSTMRLENDRINRENNERVVGLKDVGVLARRADGTVYVPETAEFKKEDNSDSVKSGLTAKNQASDGGDDYWKSKRNRIVFGAPGTGKSHKLEDDRKKHFEDKYERVTFYPTYSYAQFVGTYKPVMRPVEGGEEIAYKFVPGPFLRLLVNAVVAPEKDFLLLIEEINRANAAAVFGDVFQLLDRKDGVSEYPVAASEDVKAFLISELTKRNLASGFGMSKENGTWIGECKLSLPKNFYIWATMNSADQGVFPMDTAFKRRWNFEYIGVDAEANDEDLENLVIEGEKYSYGWNNVRRLINALLAADGVNEDKLMGPYFIQPREGTSIDLASFKSKVLMYLWEDAGRMIRRSLLGDKVNTYSELIKGWDANGVDIFRNSSKHDKIDEKLWAPFLAEQT